MKKVFMLCTVGLLLFLFSGCAGPIGRHVVKGEYTQAIDLYEKSPSKEDIDSTEIYFAAIAYVEAKKFDKVLPHLDLLDKRCAIEGWIEGRYVTDTMRSQYYIDTGDYGLALVYAKKAQEIILENYKNNGSESQLRACQLETLGLISLSYALLKNKEEARRYIQLQEDNLKAIPKRSWDTGLTKAYNYIASTWFTLEEWDKALEAVKNEITYVSDQNPLRGLDYQLFYGASEKEVATINVFPKAFMVGKANYEIGEFKKAKTIFDKLLQSPVLSNFGNLHWELLRYEAALYFREGNRDRALDMLKKAVAVIESQRSTINTEASKIGFAGNKQTVYRDLVALLIEMGRPGEAFEYVERGKARALIDMLASKKSFGTGQAKEEIQLASLLQELDTSEKEIATAVYQNAGEMNTRSASSRSVVLRSKLHEASPSTVSLITVSAPGVQEIQQLLPKGETLVEYFGSGQDLFVFVLSADGIQAIKLNGKGLDIDIAAYRKALQSPASQDYIDLGRDLYFRLLAPVTPLIRTSNLTIVPHGPIHYLPFASLNTGKEEYLIDRYNLRVLPSASVMKFLLKGSQGKKGSALVFGNPDLGDAKLDLPYAQAEAQSLGRMIPGSKVLIRKQATKTAAIKFGDGFKYVHFACHGVFDPDKPLASGLMLAKGSADDGMLTVGELYETRMGADLVTLSACETALGKIGGGDDVVGFTRGFLYAGANSIVSSLWEVDDQATGELMQGFYRHLEKEDKRTALKKAQIAVKKRTKTSHPFYWAAFQLTGAVE